MAVCLPHGLYQRATAVTGKTTPPEVGRAFEQAGNREAMGMVMG